MSYTINYTDVANKGTITVQDSTINRETTLGFPGRNSTAYGATIAENFLHLLESFASNNPPSSPVEGQLWYDNTLTEEKLMVYNDTNWVPASGISKSINTPAIAQLGDLWVDTDNQQLYLFTGGGWVLIGPSFSDGLATGAKADQIIGQDNISYNILRIEVSGQTIGIISGSSTPFIPKTTIAGFAAINPGFNLINKDTDNDGLTNFKFFGTAEKAENLIVNNEIVAAGNFLRGNTTSTSTFPLNIQNNQGINYGVNAELTVGVEGNAGVIQHNIGGSNIDMRVRNNDVAKTVIRVDSNLRVGINTEAPEQALDVVGTIQSSGNVIINSTTQSTTINNGALQVRGGAGIRQNLNVGGQTKLSDLLTSNSIVPDDTNIRDLGSSTRYYRNTYSTNFIGTLDGTVNGKVNGPSTSSANLINKTTFVMTGDVATLVPIEFDGAYQDPQFDNGEGIAVGEVPLTKTFRTEISNQFISRKPREIDVAGDDLLLFNDVDGAVVGLKSVTKDNFLKTIPRTPAGVILPFGGDVTPSDDWILCDGRELDKTDYQALFQVIGYKFKPESQVATNNFAVPDMRGRMPMGADNMGGSSANNVTATSADIIGALDGSETKVIDVTNLPEHQHNLQDQDRNQFYAIQDRQDPSTDTNVTGIDGPTATNSGQKLANSGNVISANPVGQEFNIMPPTVTMNYIIYSGRG